MAFGPRLRQLGGPRPLRSLALLPRSSSDPERGTRPILRRSTAITLLVAVVAVSGCGAPADRNLALRSVNTTVGKMVVTGDGATVYIYLPDQTHPSETTCTGDCANDWPPVTLTTASPDVSGIDKSRIGLVVRPDGTRQLTLDGYPLYRFAGDLRPGETRGESVGNTWFAVSPDGNFLPVAPAGYQSSRTPAAAQPIRVATTAIGRIVTSGNGQTLYTYKDDSPASSACIAAWCVQDWPPLLVNQAPSAVEGIGAPMSVIRRPDGTLQLTLAGHPLYRFSGDQHPGDTRGLGIGHDWYPISPGGSSVGAQEGA